MDMRVRKRPIHPMPELSAFISNLKEAFGQNEIDEAIRRGKAGEPTFFGRENGRSVGTPSPPQTNVWRADDSLRDRRLCKGCDGSCIGTGERCGSP
jgi:hypothetical protein